MKKIIKIITATGNKNLNIMLKKEKDFEILENDIFYKEGILEYLENNKKIDVLILYEKLSGEINIIKLIKKIKTINNEINIFFVLDNKNEKLEKILKNENIKNIFYNDEINIEDFIVRIKNTKINIEEKLKKEIKILKNIIEAKDKKILEYKNSLINTECENEETLEKSKVDKKVKILKNKPNKKIIKIDNGEKIEIIITKIKKYSINNKIKKNIIKNKK